MKASKDEVDVTSLDAEEDFQVIKQLVENGNVSAQLRLGKI